MTAASRGWTSRAIARSTSCRGACSPRFQTPTSSPTRRGGACSSSRSIGAEFRDLDVRFRSVAGALWHYMSRARRCGFRTVDLQSRRRRRAVSGETLSAVHDHRQEPAGGRPRAASRVVSRCREGGRRVRHGERRRRRNAARPRAPSRVRRPAVAAAGLPQHRLRHERDDDRGAGHLPRTAQARCRSGTSRSSPPRRPARFTSWRRRIRAGRSRRRCRRASSRWRSGCRSRGTSRR